MTPKEIVYSILIFLTLIIGGYWIVSYNTRENKRQDAEIDLTAKQQERATQNDSIKVERVQLLKTIDSLINNIKKTEQITRINYATNKRQREIEIHGATADYNRRFNDNFILNFKPKY